MNSPLGPKDAGALPAGKTIHAGFWRRVAAFTLDHLILAIPFAALFVIPFVGWLLALAGKWLYFALLESSAWQATPGKRVMGIKVTDRFGQRIGFGRASGRFFGGFVSFILSQMGYMMAAFTPLKQALHDMMAGTLVVFHAVRPGQPPPAQRPPMPWYGWALNALFLAPFITMLVVAPYALYEQRGHQTKASQAVAAAVALTEEIAGKGCQPGTHPPPDPWIASVTVSSSTRKSRRASAACKVSFTFLQAPEVPQDLRNATLILTSGEGEPQPCAPSSLIGKYAPQACRAP